MGCLCDCIVSLCSADRNRLARFEITSSSGVPLSVTSLQITGGHFKMPFNKKHTRDAGSARNHVRLLFCTVKPIYVEHGCIKICLMSNVQKIFVKIPCTISHFLYQTTHRALWDIPNFPALGDHIFMPLDD